jgi:hypothetical protein
MGLLDRFRKNVTEASSVITGIEDADDYKYHRVDSKTLNRDLPPLDHEKMISNAYWLYDHNPFAHRIIDMTVEFIIGEGVTFQADHADVQKRLELFWSDPINNMEINQENFLRDLALAGEQIYSIGINPINGLVRIAYIDPQRVSGVVYNKDNALVPEWVVLSKRNNEKYNKAFQVVHPSTNPSFLGKMTVITETKARNGRMVVQDKTLPKKGEVQKLTDKLEVEVVGTCAYFSVNKPISGTRGRSDILSLLDWLDAYDQFMWARLERVKAINNVVWKILMKGKTEADLRKVARTFPEFKPNSQFFHNENMDIEPVTAKFISEDAASEAAMFKGQILGGSGFPPTWFGETVRSGASAAEMNDPAFKRLLSRQRVFINILSTLFRVQIDQSVIAGTIRPTVSKDVNINLPDLSVRDNQRITSSLNRLTQSLSAGIEAGVIDKEKAAEVYDKAIRTLGFDLGKDRKLSATIMNTSEE